MSDAVSRVFRVGGPVSDLCRACKVIRDHTVMALEGGRPVRVMCDYCRSQHNYRGGDAGKTAAAPVPVPHPPQLPRPRLAGAHAESAPESAVGPEAAPRVNPVPREAPAALPLAASTPAHTYRTGVPLLTTSPTHDEDLEALLRRVVREELGLSPTAPAPRWSGGTMVLRPGKAGLQEKTLPIDTLFHKVVMIRNRLRTLEQQLNAAEIPEDLKLRLQTYVTGCYGSLTSFNILFASEADQFRGSGGEE